jgi:hypothetical protein
MSKGKKDPKKGLWAFLTQICREPTPFDVIREIAKADFLLAKVKSTYDRNENFDKETEKIQYLKGIIAVTDPLDKEHQVAKKELYKILKL